MKFEDLKIINDYQESEVVERNSIIKGDCLEVMKEIRDKSVDMILCDLPYETTKCSWDIIIPFDLLWEQYKRVIKDNGAIVLFGSQPFTSKLIMSNINMFKYEWIWDKVKPNGHLVAKIRPMQKTESIMVFSKNKVNYYPIMIDREKKKKSKEYKRTEIMGGNTSEEHKVNILSQKYPQNILTFSNANQNGKLHPTQKPTALLEYLIKTYTLEGELILDNTAGSMSTAIASINTNRDFIMIEKDDKYFEIGTERIKNSLLNKVEI